MHPKIKLKKTTNSAAEAGKLATNVRVEQRQQSFGEPEHEGIGNEAFGEFIKDRFDLKSIFSGVDDESKVYNAITCEFRFSDTLKLTAGQIVALAGDFYGIPKEPICGHNDSDKKIKEKEMVRRFKKACATLLEIKKPADQYELKNILDVFQEAKNDLVLGTAAGRMPNDSLQENALARDIKYIKATLYRGSIFGSRYKDLSAYNFDHFTHGAKDAYRIGHEVAIRTAKKAYNEQDIEKKKYLLLKAFGRELFACHFLTDLFAGGHIRTPRKELYDYVSEFYSSHERYLYLPITPEELAGLLAMRMHEEDNKGIKVKNGNKTWTAFGDNHYFNPLNEDNRELVVSAVMKSLEDIYFVSIGQQPTYEYLKILPESVEPQDRQPLFKLENGILKRREDLSEVTCKKYIDVESNPFLIQTKFLLLDTVEGIGAIFHKMAMASAAVSPPHDEVLTKDEIDELNKYLNSLNLSCRHAQEDTPAGFQP